MVAIIGGDGSGKSTAVATLGSWLGSVFEVRTVHLGKPRWSAVTYGTRAVLKAAAMVSQGLQRLLPLTSTQRLTALISTYRPLIWLLCTARDRRRAYRDSRRFAINGGLVLCDRYPHPRLKSMEVPQIARLTEGRLDGPVVSAMIALEQRLHSAIVPPELLVLLRLDPEIAVERKPTETPESVRARGSEIWDADWRDVGVHVIDASQPPGAVGQQLKELVWSVLA